MNGSASPMLRLLALGVLAVYSAGAVALEYTFPVQRGYVAFTVGDDWAERIVQRNLPVAMASFEIPGEGYASTHVAITLYEHGSRLASEASSEIGHVYGTPLPGGRHGGWTIARQRADQDGTAFTIVDAKKNLGSVTAGVRLSWPQGSARYDQQMERELDALLDSVHAVAGK